MSCFSRPNFSSIATLPQSLRAAHIRAVEIGAT
jgi:hypothetical protein